MARFKQDGKNGFLEYGDDGEMVGHIPSGHPKIKIVEAYIADGGVIDPADPAPDTRIADIKAEARNRIISIVDKDKQDNYNARMNELNHKRLDAVLAGNPDPLTQSEIDEIAFMEGVWSQVKSIRAVSNTAEADGTALADIVWPV